MAATKIPKGIELITQFVLEDSSQSEVLKKLVSQVLKKLLIQSFNRMLETIEIILKNMGVDPKNLKSTDDVLKHMNYP